MNKNNKYETYYERSQQTSNCFDNMKRRCSQDKLIGRKEYEASSKNSTKYEN